MQSDLPGDFYLTTESPANLKDEATNVTVRIPKLQKETKKEINIRDSNVVPHRSTNLTRRCLTSLSGREAVLSSWYGRFRQEVFMQIHILYLRSLKSIGSQRARLRKPKGRRYRRHKIPGSFRRTQHHHQKSKQKLPSICEILSEYTLFLPVANTYNILHRHERQVVYSRKVIDLAVLCLGRIDGVEISTIPSESRMQRWQQWRL